MKKKFVSILTIMLFVVLCVALSACSANSKHQHTLSADDGDCTTAITCAERNEETWKKAPRGGRKGLLDFVKVIDNNCSNDK